MARAFRATTHGYRAELDAHERRLLTGLCADVIQLLQARAEEVGEQAPADAGGTAEDDDADPVFAHFRAELAGLGEGLEELGGSPEDDDGAAPGLAAPEDEVLARLLPDAHEDPEEAGQLRRLAEGSLRDSKISDLRTARMLLESTSVILAEEQAPIFGRALNDLRLTLSVRLGIEEEADAERVHQVAAGGSIKSTESFMAEIYTFITWLQESLFSAMLRVMPDEEEPEG
ncbi:DUF2017 family protein [Nesterenkonia populi]|uniref:DUF2017 family protein n=1 Tax=Nesterenkonia populi TaxID=1591087 RepID=UPI0011BE51FC|nr:DUF2017 family protein [Nesterenkonia populi]